MKKFLLLNFILFGFFTASAQTPSSNSSIGITIGPSIPVGSFGNKERSKSGGLAKIGGFLGIAYVYKLNKNIGLMVNVQGRIHDVDNNALRIEGIPESIAKGATFNSGSWKMGAVMVGPFHTISLTKTGKFNFEFKLMGGYQYTLSPDINASLAMPNQGMVQLQVYSKASNSFAYLLGAGLSHQVNQKLTLRFAADYSGTISESSQGIFAIGPAIRQLRRDTDAVNLGLGLTVHF